MINIQITKDETKANAFTHAGVFHADDVFSTVLLGQMFDIVLARVNHVPLHNVNCIVYDIGLGKFDHHQPTAALRPSGNKYASFGLLWKHYGMKYLTENNGCTQEIANIAFNIIDKMLVEGVDAIDNGQVERSSQGFQIMSVSGAISAFNPNWDSYEDNDVAFMRAVKFAEIIFNNTVESAISKACVKEEVDKAIESSGSIMELDKFMPWEQFLFESTNENAPNILYVIYPSNRGGYHIKAVPDAFGSFGMRKAFPKSWAGKRNEDLENESGVLNVTFCHTERFLCAAKTKEAAWKLALAAVITK